MHILKINASSGVQSPNVPRLRLFTCMVGSTISPSEFFIFSVENIAISQKFLSVFVDV